jgi:hypothetical protein
MIYAAQDNVHPDYFASSGFRLADAHSATDGVDPAVALLPDRRN